MSNQGKFHPKLKDDGAKVWIKSLTSPSDPSTWLDFDAAATFIPEGDSPSEINRLALAACHPTEEDIRRQANSRSFEEPEYHCPKGLQPAAGAIVVEPDGRVWLVHPSNGYGGYECTFPKGRTEGEPLRESAVREVFEEAGLLVELLDYLGDSKRTATFTRYYVARRISGTPTGMGWESQAVSLAPLNKLANLLNSKLDHALVKSLEGRKGEWRGWFKDEVTHAEAMKKYLHDPRYGLTSVHRILLTVDAFRERHGEWPTRVSMDEGMFDAIPRGVLSKLGWACMVDRVKLDGQARGTVIAADEVGQVIDYNDVAMQAIVHRMADVWIWGVPLI